MTTQQPDHDLLAEMLLALDATAPLDLVAEIGRVLQRGHGVDLVDLYLTDYEERTLRSLNGGVELDPIGSVAGEAVRLNQVVEGMDGTWVPLALRGEPMGAMLLRGVGDDLRGITRAIGLAVGAALQAVRRQSDSVEVVRGAGELRLAATLQRGLLPNPDYVDPRIELSGRIEPAYDIAGDAFDYAVDDGAHFAVFDAMGHGLRAALLTSLTTAAYRFARRRHERLEDVYTEVDRVVAMEARPYEFVTGVTCRMDLAEQRAVLVNAGHVLPLRWRSGRVEELREVRPTLPFGLGGAPQRVVIDVEPGDLLMFYSDGMIEASGGGAPWGLERLVERLGIGAAEQEPLRLLCRMILDEVKDFVGSDLRDDATLLAVRLAA